MKWLELQRSNYSKVQVLNLEPKDYSINDLKRMLYLIDGQFMGMVERIRPKQDYKSIYDSFYENEYDTLYSAGKIDPNERYMEIDLTLTWFRLSDIGVKYKYSKYFRPEHDTIPRLIEIK